MILKVGFGKFSPEAMWAKLDVYILTRDFKLSLQYKHKWKLPK